MKDVFLDWGADPEKAPVLIEPRGDKCFVPLLGVELEELDPDDALNTDEVCKAGLFPTFRSLFLRCRWLFLRLTQA